MLVDRSEPLPLWALVRADLRAQHADGGFGNRFQTDNELLTRYGVSRQTVREAVPARRVAPQPGTRRPLHHRALAVTRSPGADRTALGTAQDAMSRRSRGRADEWALTSAFALLPALAVALGALLDHDLDVGSVALGVYFAVVSLLLYMQSRYVRRHPFAALHPRTIRVVIPGLLAVGLMLAIVDLLTDGKL